MVRSENGKPNIEAGLDLARALQKLGYKQGILCFTGPTYLKPNQEKFKAAGLHNVYATARGIEAENFAKFKEELPGTLPEHSTLTPMSSSSTSSTSSPPVSSSTIDTSSTD